MTITGVSESFCGLPCPPIMPKNSRPYSTTASRMTAVLSRDHKADGGFVFAVTTTGVFCRPGCPSRLPRAENVRLFDSPSLAIKAGFRPCKRCHPDSSEPYTAQADWIADYCRWLDEAEATPTLAQLAGAAGLSRFHFLRRFKEATGTTPKAYAQAARANRTREALRGSASVTEAMHSAGYNSTGRFYASSTELLGMLPATYRDGGKGEIIEFAVCSCSFGFILVAATGKGVCAILLGDEPETLVGDLCRRFSKASLRPGASTFEKSVSAAVEFVEQPETRFPLPLDVRGTLFQQRVWKALRGVKPGEHITYTALAERLGAPRSVRAVASACAANPAAVAIPCHRVVRADGSLAGYRWGLERKRTLLARERERSAAP